MPDSDHEIRVGGGGLSSRSLDKETGKWGGGGVRRSPKNFFRLFMPQFGPKKRGARSPGPSPRSATGPYVNI